MGLRGVQKQQNGNIFERNYVDKMEENQYIFSS